MFCVKLFSWLSDDCGHWGCFARVSGTWIRTGCVIGRLLCIRYTSGSQLGSCAPPPSSSRGSHHICNGPQQNERKISGPPVNFEWITARIKYFKFINWTKSFSPASPAALKAKSYFIAVSDFTSLNLVSVGWIYLLLKVRNRLLWREVIFAYRWPHGNQAFRILQVCVWPKEHTEYKANY